MGQDRQLGYQGCKRDQIRTNCLVQVHVQVHVRKGFLTFRQGRFELSDHGQSLHQRNYKSCSKQHILYDGSVWIKLYKIHV